MLTFKRKQPEAETPPEKAGLRWDAFIADLRLFLSLTLARLIVWRVLRARRKERAARIKSLRVIKGGGKSPGDTKAASAASLGEEGTLRDATRSSSSGGGEQRVRMAWEK